MKSDTDTLDQFERTLLQISVDAEVKALEAFASPIPGHPVDAARLTLQQRQRVNCARIAALRLILAAQDSGYEITTVYADDQTQLWSRDRDGAALGPALDAMIDGEKAHVRFQMPGAIQNRFLLDFQGFAGDSQAASPVARYAPCVEGFFSCPDGLSNVVARIIDAAAGRA